MCNAIFAFTPFVALLKRFSKKYKYKLLNIKPYKINSKTISSTKIRKYLKSGNIYLPNILLSEN